MPHFFLCHGLLDCPLTLNPTLSPGYQMPTSLGIFGGKTVLPEGRCCVLGWPCAASPDTSGREHGKGKPISFCREAAPGNWERTPSCRVTDPEPQRFTKEIPGPQVPVHTPLHLIYKRFAQFKHAQGFPEGSPCSYRFLSTSVLYASALHFKILPLLSSQRLWGHLLQEAPGAAVPASTPTPMLQASSRHVSLQGRTRVRPVHHSESCGVVRGRECLLSAAPGRCACLILFPNCGSSAPAEVPASCSPLPVARTTSCVPVSLGLPPRGTQPSWSWRERVFRVYLTPGSAPGCGITHRGASSGNEL